MYKDQQPVLRTGISPLRQHAYWSPYTDYTGEIRLARIELPGFLCDNVSTMLRMTCKKLFAFLIFIYFLCYTVAPVSSVMPSGVTEAENIAGFQNSSRTLLLYDFVLWEILKKTIKPDNPYAQILEIDDDESKSDSSNVKCFLHAVPSSTERFSRELFQWVPFDQGAVSPCLFSDHSGLSPPSLA